MRLVPLVLLAAACTGQRIADDDPDFIPWDGGEISERKLIRVATWNVQVLGSVGSSEYESTLDILRRMDADIVGLNEVEYFEHDVLDQLAADAGYATVFVPDDQPFGGAGNAIMARLEATRLVAPTSSELSGDESKDVTRLPVVFTAPIPGTDAEISVVIQHWKSGFDDTDNFRRAVDGWRTRQAAELGGASDLLVVMGDVNQQLMDSPGDPALFQRIPGGEMPFSYDLGQDVRRIMDDPGIANDPFSMLAEIGLLPVDALQRDGSPATRPASGRIIDYIFVNGVARAEGLRAEIYDSADEGREGIADAGAAPAANASRGASDHLPVLVELRVPAPTD